MITFQQYLQESINDKGILKALFLAGVPASGKTYIQQKINSSIHPKVINTDTFSRKYFGVKKEAYDIFGEVPDDIVSKSTSSTQKQLTQYVDGMLPLIIDSTSSNPSNLIKRNGILQGVGYDTGMVFVYTSLETALRRNANRIKEGKGGVPEDFLKETHDKIIKMMSYYKENFKFFKVINNDLDYASDINLGSIMKSIYTFYYSDVNNPIGKDIITNLKEQKKKYISDINPSLLQHTNGWY